MDPIKRMYEIRDEQARENARNYRKPPQRFRASELGNCKREIWYRLSGYVPAPRYGSSDDYGIDGDAHHDLVRQMMEHYGTPVRGIEWEDGQAREMDWDIGEFEYDGMTINISARLDGWVDIDGEEYLLEIKSMGYWPYKYLQEAYENGFRDKDGVEHEAGEPAVHARIQEKHPGYVQQMNACMAIFNAKQAYLVVKDRSGCTMGVHNRETGDRFGGGYFTYDPDLFNDQLRRLHRIKMRVLDGSPPPPEYTAGSPTCKRCDYRYACHGATKRRQRGLTPAMVYPDPAVGLEFEENDNGSDA